MTTIPLSEAQANLADLAVLVERGEEFVVTVDGRPLMQLSRVEQAASPIPATGQPDVEYPEGLTEEQKSRLLELGYGSMKGQLSMADEFDEPVEDFADYQ